MGVGEYRFSDENKKKPEPSDLIQAEWETLNMSISKGVHFDNAPRHYSFGGSSRPPHRFMADG